MPEKKPQWREVTNKILQVPVNRKDFVGCLFLYEGAPLFRVGWTLSQLASIQTDQQIAQVTSAIIGGAPPFKFTIDNSGFRCWIKTGIGTPPPSTLIVPN